MFLVQHGFQKGRKITDGLAAGRFDGVIWSPGDETPQNLAAAIRDASAAGLPHQAIDPQLYVATLQTANTKKLTDYGYFSANMQPADFSPRRIVELVHDCIDFQAGLDVTAIILPTVSVDAVGGRWAQVASSLAQAGIDDWSNRSDDRPLFASVAVTSSLLANQAEVDALLDDLTSLIDVEGFYLLAEINPEAGSPRYDELLEQAMWMAYSLSELNGFRVWTGYSGICGYLLRAAGAEGFGAGWWQKLNWWSPSHWLEGGGGRFPRPRVLLDSILGSILLAGELEAVYRLDRGLYDDLVAGVGPVAAQLRGTAPTNVVPDREAQAAQIFEVCHHIDGRVSGDFVARAQQVISDIRAATRLHNRIRAANITLEQQSGPRKLAAWDAALHGLAARIGVSL